MTRAEEPPFHQSFAFHVSLPPFIQIPPQISRVACDETFARTPLSNADLAYSESRLLRL
jgi:hypothetical protein